MASYQKNDYLNRLEADGEDGNSFIDRWDTDELLCLAQSAVGCNKDWTSVCRSMKKFGEQTRPSEWYTPKNCALQYIKLLSEFEEDSKKKTLPRTERETSEVMLVKNLREKRMRELECSTQQYKAKADVLKTYMEMVDCGDLDEELDDLLIKFEEDEKLEVENYKQYVAKRDELLHKKKLNKSRVIKGKALTKVLDPKKKSNRQSPLKEVTTKKEAPAEKPKSEEKPKPLAERKDAPKSDETSPTKSEAKMPDKKPRPPRSEEDKRKTALTPEDGRPRLGRQTSKDLKAPLERARTREDARREKVDSPMSEKKTRSSLKKEDAKPPPKVKDKKEEEKSKDTKPPPNPKKEEKTTPVKDKKEEVKSLRERKPPPSREKKKEKPKAKKEDESPRRKMAGKERAPRTQSEEKDNGKGAKTLEKDDEYWCDDTDAEAVAQRMESLTSGAKGLMLDDLKKLHHDRLDLFYEFVKKHKETGTIENLQKELVGEAERLDIKDEAVLVLCHLLLTERIFKEFKTHKLLFLRFTHGNHESQKYFLGGFEQFIDRYKDSMMNQVPHILKVFYDADILEKEVLIDWSQKVSYVTKEVAQEIHEKAKPFFKWLHEAQSSKDDDEEEAVEDDEYWCDDTDAEAVARRMESLTSGAKGLMLDDLKKSLPDRLDLFYEFVKKHKETGTIENLQKELVGEAERLDIKDKAVLVLCHLLLTERIFKEFKTHKLLFLRFTHGNHESQKYFLGGFEQFIDRYKDSMMNQVPHILKVFYDADILEKEVLIDWSQKVSYVTKEVAQEIHEKAKPFFKWLHEAQSSKDDDEEEAVEVVYSDHHISVEKELPKPVNTTAPTEDDNFDIDAI